VIRLFLSCDDFVHAVETAAAKVVRHTGDVGLDENYLAGVDFSPPDEFDHAMNRGRGVDHGVVLKQPCHKRQRLRSRVVKPPQPHWFFNSSKLFSQSARSR
jgi:hypothetical protein